MRIYTDDNGVYVNAISMLSGGDDVEGHMYGITAMYKNVNLEFQKGGVATHGVNGITSESLLAVLIHRTEYLNRLFPCHENVLAINSLKEAMQQFNMRTDARKKRGVEGHEVV